MITFTVVEFNAENFALLFECTDQSIEQAEPANQESTPPDG